MLKDLFCYSWVKNSFLFDDDVKGFIFYETEGVFHTSTMYRCVTSKTFTEGVFPLNEVEGKVCSHCDADLTFKLDHVDDVFVEELILFEPFLVAAEKFNTFTGSLEEIYIACEVFFETASRFNISLINILLENENDILKEYAFHVNNIIETFNTKVHSLHHSQEFKSIVREEALLNVLHKSLLNTVKYLTDFFVQKRTLAVKLVPELSNVTSEKDAFKVFEHYLFNDLKNDTRRVFYVAPNVSWAEPLNKALVSINMVSCDEDRVIFDFSVQEFIILIRECSNFASLDENTFSVQLKSLTESEVEIVSALIPTIENVDSVLSLDTVIESASII